MSLVRGLHKKGHEIAFLGSCPTLLEKCEEARFMVHKLEIGPPPVTKWGAVSFLWRQVEMKRRLLEIMGHKSHLLVTAPLSCELPACDFIFMLSLTEKLLLTDWAVENGMKVFWIEHDRVGRWLTKNPWLPKLKKLSRKVKTIVVSDLSKSVYVELGWRSEDVISIPNGIDVEKFAANKREPNLLNVRSGRAPFRIGCIARLSHEKGIDVLIEAVAPLTNISLTIVGRGREEMHIQELLRKKLRNSAFDIQQNIHSVGDFYRSIDCLVLPSRDHDPFGLVVAEAMAAGVPTICTDACGIAEHL